MTNKKSSRIPTKTIVALSLEKLAQVKGSDGTGTIPRPQVATEDSKG